MYRFFQVNRDIFFRTICLVAVTVFFTSAGAAQGEVVLAVNTLLMQLFTLFSYIMDGFAYAGEALAGRYIGANNQKALHTTVRQLFGWGVGLSLAFTLLYSIGGQSFLGLLTDETTVIHASESYFYWVLAIPLAGFSAFFVRWNIHRCDSHPSDAESHDSSLCQFLSYLLWFPGDNGQITLYGWHSLPIFYFAE